MFRRKQWAGVVRHWSRVTCVEQQRRREEPIVRKASDKSKLRGILQNTGPVVLPTVGSPKKGQSEREHIPAERSPRGHADPVSCGSRGRKRT